MSPVVSPTYHMQGRTKNYALYPMTVQFRKLIEIEWQTLLYAILFSRLSRSID